jgi:hypothetical protein
VNPHEVLRCMELVVQDFRTCTWAPMETCAYTWAHSRDKCVHFEKSEVIGRTINYSFLGLSIVVFLSVGHYPCYWSPDFSIIK